MERPEKGVSLWYVLSYLRQDWMDCGLAVLLAIMVGSANTWMPMLKKQVVDLLTEGPVAGNLQSLLISVVKMALLEAAMELLHVWARNKTLWLQQKMALRLFGGALEKVFSNDLAAHQNDKVDALLHRLHQGVYGFTEAAFQTALNLLPGIFSLVSAVVWMLSLDWRLCLVASSFAWLPALFSYCAGKILEDMEAEVNKRWQKAYGRLYEALSLFKSVKALCMEYAEQQRYLEEVSEAMYAPLRGLASIYENVRKASVHLKSVFTLLNAEPKVQDAADAITLEQVEGLVSFDVVCFAYKNDRPPILKDVSFQVRGGQMMALVGRSGSGKTTIADLLYRFHDPDSGQITIDGTNVARLKQSWWRRQIGPVLQDTAIFQSTIRENIAYGKPNATDAEIAAAAQAAHAADFIERLPVDTRQC